MSSFKDGFNYFEKTAPTYSGSISGFNYIESIESQIDKLNTDINSFHGYNTPIEQLKGDIFEFWHSGTHNIDAALKGVKARTFVDRSHNFASPDITSNYGESYGLKNYSTGVVSAKAQAISYFEKYNKYKGDAMRENKPYQTFEEFLESRGISQSDVCLHDPIYQGQIRIIPKDEMEEAIGFLERKINEESIKRPELVNRYQETLDMLRDRIRSDEGSESILISSAENRTIARAAKEGEFDASDYGLTVTELMKYKYIIQQSYNAGITAATISVILRVAPEIYKVIEHLVANGTVDEEQFKKVGIAAIQGGAEGFIRGSMAAALTITFKAGLFGDALKSVDPIMIGAATVLLMNAFKNSYKVAKGDLTKSEFVEACIRDTIIISCSMILGGFTQGIIEIPIVGFMLGSFVGSVVGAFAYDTGYKALLSFCVDSGFTFFGLVEQDYSLPPDILKTIGIEVFGYEKYSYDKVEPIRFESIPFTYDKYELPTINITFVRRGVIGVNRIGYVK